MSEEELKNYVSDEEESKFHVNKTSYENIEFTNYFDILLDIDSKTKLEN